MFSIRLFGYDRTEVEQRLNELQTQLDELNTAYEDAKQQARTLQAQVEDYSIRLAAARRDRMQALSKNTAPPANAIILVGPVSTFAVLASLADRLDEYPELSIEFRMFRDGLYRIDAWVEHMPALKAWLEQQPEVREVRLEENTLHVILKEVVES